MSKFKIEALDTGEDEITVKPLRDLSPDQQKAYDTILEWKDDPGSQQVLTFGGLAGTGKAQPLDALVYTPRGPIPMGAVAVGAVVCTPDGGCARVTGVFPQGQLDAWRLRFDDGTEVEACKDHLWEVQDRRDYAKGPCIVSTEEIVKSLDLSDGTSRWYIPAVAPVAYDERKLKIDPYLLGALIANGSIGDGLAMHCRSADVFVLERCGRALAEWSCRFNTTHDCTHKIIGQSGVRGPHSESIPLRDTLRELGLWGTHSETKFIPIDYLLGSVVQRLALVQGLFDGDGTVDRKTGMASYSTSSPLLAADVKTLIESLGGRVTVTTRFPLNTVTGRRGLLNYNLHVRYQETPELFSLPRKKSLAKARTVYGVKRKIISAEFLGAVECQCILVDHPAHLYITNGFVATHNTTVIAKLAHELGSHAVYCAYTGKATSVLKRKLREADVHGFACSTIHSLIYTPSEDSYCNCGHERDTHDVYDRRRRNATKCNFGHGGDQMVVVNGQLVAAPPCKCPQFNAAGGPSWILRERLGGDNGPPPSLIVVDEGSMINAELWADLKTFNIPILVVGDHGQLPPIGDTSVSLLLDPDIKLEKIHRQAADNPVLALAHHIRAGINPQRFKSADNRVVFAKSAMAGYQLTKDPINTALIVYRNKTRVRLNGLIRGHLGRSGEPQPDDVVICLKNDKPLFNGMRGVLEAHRLLPDDVSENQLGDIDDSIITFQDDGFRMAGKLCEEQFGAEKTFRYPHDAGYRNWGEAGLLFDYGYAMTCHKCVVGDTLITTRKGLVKISELAAGISPGTFIKARHRVAGLHGWNFTDQVYAGGVKPTIRATTRAGFSLEGSHKHPLLVATAEGRVWKKMPELRVGDALVIRAGIGAEGFNCVSTKNFKASGSKSGGREHIGSVPKEVNESLAWLLGALIGDGNLTDRDDGRVGLTKGNGTFVREVAETVEALFNVKPTVRNQGTKTDMYFHGRKLREFLVWLGIDYVKSPQKVTPWPIFKSPLHVQRAYLRGLFDTDGWVNDRLVGFSTSSPQLAHEVQQLLLNVGVVARRYLMRGATNGLAPAWRVEISGIDVDAFTVIGFSNQVKQKRLEKLDGVGSSYKSNWGEVPGGKQLATKLRHELRAAVVPVAVKVSTRLSSIICGAAKFRRSTAMFLVDELAGLELGPAAKEIRTLVRDGIFYDPIVSITKGRAPVFDVHVPKTHDFVGSGIVNHNSQGSQFRDVVVALYDHFGDEAIPWGYTAVTRAEERVILV